MQIKEILLEYATNFVIHNESSLYYIVYVIIFFFFCRLINCMKNKFLPFIFLYSIIVLSQDIQINWDGFKNISNDSTQISNYPIFKNNYAVENNQIYFVFAQKTANSGSISIRNLNWEPISKNELFDFNEKLIPKEFSSVAKINLARDEFYISIKLIPFKKENNQIYRLRSFSYFIDNKKSANRVSNSATVTPITSILNSNNFYKIKVDTTGVFKIDRAFLVSHFSESIVSAINPKNIRIYGNGGKMLNENIDDFRYTDLQENAIEVIGENDNTFDTNDYILFYAQGPNSWNLPSNGSLPNHETNLYENYAYYYLNFDIGVGKRIQDDGSTSIPSSFFTSYDDFRVYDPEKFNINQNGRIWVGDSFLVKDTQSVSFTISNFDSSAPLICRYSVLTNQANNQKIALDFNGSNISNSIISSTGFYNEFIQTLSISTNTSNTIQATLKVDSSPNPSGVIYFNYIELIFKQKLSYNGKQFNFRRRENLNTNSAFGFKISNNSGLEQVWDVSDITNISRKKDLIAGGDFEINYQSNSPDFRNEFVAFNSSSAFKPTFVGKIDNQNIHSIQDTDMLIVAPKAFLSQANQLKNYHKTLSNLDVNIVSPQEIYNEFSSGSQDITAIRDFFRYVYQTSRKRLKYVLLLGDSSYDYKDRISNNTNIIPSYQSYQSNPISTSNGYVTDDYYTILDDGEIGLDTSQLDIAIGRLVADDVPEAQLLTNKIVMYNNELSSQKTATHSYNPFGDWRLKTHLVVDIDKGIAPFHQDIEIGLANWFETNRKIYTVRKLYQDAYVATSTPAGLRFPQINDGITNAVSTGSLYLSYFGHGGPRGWSQYRVLTDSDISTYNNLNVEFTRLPLITTVTCDFTVWDNPAIFSGGENLLKKTDGGAIGIITTSRPIFVFFGEIFTPILNRRLFEYSDPTNTSYVPMGEALRRSKVEFGNFNDNLKIALLGDPALPLAFPPRGIKISTINGINANSFTDVIRALDFVTIEGEVLNASNTKDLTFTGKIDATLYDKPIDKETVDNLGTLGTMNFKEQVNAIYKGSTNVTNGAFKLQFYVPKDINYTVGLGKLVLYAYNYKIDAATFKDDIKIGGINPNGINDDEGPGIKLYMNNTNFANGGITDRNPVFIACVTDSTGINATGSGVGHDITAVLDNDIDGTLVLNEYFAGGEQSPCSYPNLKDYQKGKVAYQLNNLDLGNHTIHFKVWDINNNSSTASLDFIVMNDGTNGLVINKPLNWPNPFSDKTYFHFEHNCDDILEVQVQIFTISGKLIKTIRQSVTSNPFREGYRTDKFGIPWDGLDDFGDKVGKGVYVYKLNVRGQNAERCTGGATAIEKLVILK